MTKIIHLSDLHFGTEIKSVVEALLHSISEINADLIIITGDFTQRARRKQFLKAKEFIQSLPTKNVICVPGNHDIPLYNVVERFCFPLFKYHKYISNELFPIFSDETIALLGINSATPFKAMSGFVSESQLQTICDFFEKQSDDLIRVVMMHHNLIRPELHTIIENAESVIQTFAQCKVNLILSGHLHDACVEILIRPAFKKPMYVVTAGTGTSFRLRSQPNSFNYLEIEKNVFKLKIYQIVGKTFELESEHRYAFSKEI